ncbi:MAG TPA: hypothetical protein DEQ50_05535 [Lactobacillus sp.]|nr:hypothetical protein [Lactobacillus sp.]
MFTIIFWILAVWFIVNVIGMWFAINNKDLQRSLGFINVAAVIIGFLAYSILAKVASLEALFSAINYLNIIVAIVQLYFGFRTGHIHNHSVGHA